ncbi:MAG: hypothetical protein ACREDD_07710 [Methylocella sp.]
MSWIKKKAGSGSDPETGNASMIAAPAVNAGRRIARSTGNAIIDPFKRRIQAFSENDGHPHAGRATE